MARTKDEILRDIDWQKQQLNTAWDQHRDSLQKVRSRLTDAWALSMFEEGEERVYERIKQDIYTKIANLEKELEDLDPNKKYSELTELIRKKDSARTESEFRTLAEQFRKLNFGTSQQLASECEERADSIVKNLKRIAEKERVEQERIAEQERVEKPFWDEFRNLECVRRKHENRKFWKEQRDLWKEQGLCVVCGGKLSIFRHFMRKCYHKRHYYIYLSLEQIPLAELDKHLNEISEQRTNLFHKLKKSPFSELVNSMKIEMELSRNGEEAKRQFERLSYERMALKKYRKKKRRIKIRDGIFLLIASCILGLFYSRFSISQNGEHTYTDKKEYVEGLAAVRIGDIKNGKWGYMYISIRNYSTFHSKSIPLTSTMDAVKAFIKNDKYVYETRDNNSELS